MQYFRWLGAALTGDLGYSYTSAQPVLTMILERLPATIQLMLSAYLLAAVIALPLGVYSAIHKYSVLDYLGAGLSFLGIAMPVFWFGLILQLVFAVQLGWLPSSGRETRLTATHRFVAESGRLSRISMRSFVLPCSVSSCAWNRFARLTYFP